MKYKKAIRVLMMAFMVILGITGCKGEGEVEKSAGYEQISQDEAKKLWMKKTAISY